MEHDLFNNFWKFFKANPNLNFQLKPLSLLVLPPKRVVETSLTLLYEKLNNNSNDEFDVMPMDIKTFKLDFSWFPFSSIGG